MPCKLGEQRVRVVRVGRLVGDVDRIRDLRVRGAMDGLALVAVVHVAVAADRRVGRPFVAGDADEAAGLVELRRQRVELAPEGAGDLEVVALVAHDVEEGLVAAELEVFARRVGAERLVGLAVRIAPEVHQRRVRGDDAQRVGAAQLPAGLVEHADDDDRPARATRRPSTTAAKLPGAKRSVAGSPAIGALACQPQRAVD